MFAGWSAATRVWPGLIGGHRTAGLVGLPAAGAAPLDYHIVYRVTTTGDVVNTEDLWVHRPFEAEDSIYAGPTVSGSPISSIVDRLGRQLVHSGGQPSVLEPVPAPTAFDVRLDAVAGAVKDGTLAAVGRQVIAGRDCRMYRSQQALGAGPLDGKPAAADHVDSCVDGQGLVLETRRVANGKTVQTRQATSVSVGADAAGHQYATVGTHLPLRQGGGAVVTISDTSRPPELPFWQLASPPDGFSHAGRFAVVPPQPPAGPAPTTANLATEVDDVYVRGADVITVAQGQQPGSGPYQQPADGTSVDAGRVGRGQLTLSSLASSVTVPSRSSSFVRVTGTVAPDQLLAVARSLEQQSPGTIATVPDLLSDGGS